MPKQPDYKYWQALRAKSVKKWRENYKPKPIPKRTKKRAKQEREYSKLRKAALPEDEYIQCEAGLKGCAGRATEWHHPEGRQGDKLTDPNNRKLLCHSCHEYITENSKEAIELGLSKRRNT